MAKTLRQLIETLPHRGLVEWIGLRPERRAPMKSVTGVYASPDYGLEGDRYAGRSGDRHVTLIQAEHLAVIARLLGNDEPVAAEVLRRNLVVSGINLLALKGRTIAVGDAHLDVTGSCHPCSRMEETLGPGGYNAVRGHGGITARVLKGGRIAIGDPVYPLDSTTDDPRESESTLVQPDKTREHR